ncbi:MAG: nucleotide-binding domain containing protein, partial [Paracoccaceae bacterium]
ALAGRLAPGGAAEAAPPRAPVLFVVGSRAARTRRQLAVLAERLPGLAVGETAAEPDEGARAVALVPPRDEAGRDPDAVAAALADEARRLMARLAPGLVVATGGDTALALLDRLGAGTIEVLGEPWPGVVRSRLGPDGATLVTKAGGFGAETLFADVAAWAGLLPGGRVEGCPLV